MSKSITKLTPEQEEFWYSIRLRAGAPAFGQPYLSPALLQLIPVNAPGLRTMAIDRWWRVYIDFDYFMKEKGVVYAAGVLGHEPWHNLRSHSERFENVGVERNKDGKQVDPNHTYWNIAGDLTINQDIPDIVPDDGLFPGKDPFKNFPKNLTTEEYYSLVIEDAPPSRCEDCEKLKKEARDARKKEQEEADKQQPQGGSSDDSDDSQGGDSGDSDDKQDGQQGGDSDDSSQGGDSGDQEGQSGGEGGSGENPGQSESNGGNPGGAGQMPTSCPAHSNGSGNSQGQGQGNQLSENPMCGNGSEEMKDYELGSPESSGVEGIDNTQSERIRLSVAQEVRNTPPGNLPGGMKIWADEIFQGEPLDWRRELEGELKQAIAWKRGQLDYRRTRPHRRQWSREIIRPAMQSPKPRLGIAIDTSGSHLHKLPVVVTEIEAIVKQIGIRGKDLLAFGVDVQATDPKPVKNPSNVLDELEGGGGTDMRVGFQQLEMLGKQKKIDIGVLISDLESGWPEQPPKGNIKYIVCGIVDGSSDWSMRYAKQAEEAMPWAKLILIDFDERKPGN